MRAGRGRRWRRERRSRRAAVAAVLVDLSGTADTVLVNADGRPDAQPAVVDRLTAVEKSQGRTVEVRRPRAARRATTHPAGCVSSSCSAGSLGFGVVVAISLVRGPVARTAGTGSPGYCCWRCLDLAVLGIQLLPATSLPGNDLAVVALGAGYAFTLGLLTLAVEALAGLAGLAVVAAAYFVLSTPLITGTSPYLLPPPWPTLSPWTPTGAAQEAATALAYLDPARATPRADPGRCPGGGHRAPLGRATVSMPAADGAPRRAGPGTAAPGSGGSGWLPSWPPWRR